MSPLFLHHVTSPIGTILLVTDAAGQLRALDFLDYRERMDKLLARHYGPVSLTDTPTPARLAQALGDYFAGDLTALDGLTVATNGTDFQKAVWHALRAIPAGQTVTYGELARRLGQPTAMRAVGLANGANPIGIVVPCHRVVGANGTLTGYAGGLERKRWLLAHESAAGLPLLEQIAEKRHRFGA
jgi:methylated-DNA-[protein]-cysteine S-methyltransferase